jgi:ribosomal protein L24
VQCKWIKKKEKRRKAYKRQYVRVEETLTVSNVSDLITEKESSREDTKTPVKRVRAERRYSCCSETRYNSRACKVEIEDLDNSNNSE